MNTTPQGFADLGVPADLCAALTANGITIPTPIQSAVIPDALRGCDVTGRAPTGSGKTLAFGLPLIARLRSASNGRPTALVLAPTRELADQIATVLRPLARKRNHAVVTVYGGVGYGPQRSGLKAGAEIVVACPGRLEDLLQMGTVRLDQVRDVVIDEADRMADMGFLPVVRRLLALTHPDRQVQLYSATLDGAVAKLAGAVQRNPVRHEIGEVGPDLDAAHHAFWEVDRVDRAAHTADIIGQLGSTLVFCRTRHGADRLARQLDKLGVSAAPIHGGRSQPQRDKALKAFSSGAVRSLIATDVAARGVHVDGVAGVVHFDPPADAAAYIHRSGRTARAGATGVVVSLVDRDGVRDARRLQRDVGLDVEITRGARQRLTAPMTTAPPAAVSVITRLDARAHAAHEVKTYAAKTHEAKRPQARLGNGGADADRKSGTVRFFHGGRGYGFIDQAPEPDVFVHQSNLGATAPKLTTGTRVEFFVRPGRKGLEAFDVVTV